jgi:Tfp pilus assembly protein PilV
VLVAMVILTVALVSMAELMAITLRMQQLGRNQTSATRLAQDKVDELMSQNFADARLAVGGSLTADVANHFDVANPLYRRRWLVETVAADPGVAADKTRRLTVRVIPVVSDRRISPAVDLVTLLRCWPCP